jgi:hypothetical protein
MQTHAEPAILAWIDHQAGPVRFGDLRRWACIWANLTERTRCSQRLPPLGWCRMSWSVQEDHGRMESATMDRRQLGQSGLAT